MNSDMVNGSCQILNTCDEPAPVGAAEVSPNTVHLRSLEAALTAIIQPSKWAEQCKPTLRQASNASEAVGVGKAHPIRKTNLLWT